MAKIIKNNEQVQIAILPYSAWRTAVIGVIIGIIFWLLCLLMEKYNYSITTIGNTASVITVIVGIIIMIRMRMAQPLLISVSTCLALWGLFSWTNGLSVFEKLIYDFFLFGLSYSFFTWITRIKRPSFSIFISIITIIIIRVILTF